jgi:phenylalanyl-tRNA synthetase alpha chain
MSDLKQELARLRHSFDEAIGVVQGHSSQAVEQLRVQFLGKKGELTSVLRAMGSLPADERPAVGQLANQVREHMESGLEGLLQTIKANERELRLKLDRIDVTLPGQRLPQGTRHPLTKVIDEICNVFVGMGFSIAEGPEVELDEYNSNCCGSRKATPRATRKTPSTSRTTWSCAPRHRRSRSGS